jgi:hypothetical protein
MFNIAHFSKICKNKYTSSINLIFSSRTSDIIKKNIDIYNMDRIYGLIESPLVVIPTIVKTEDQRNFVDFEILLEADNNKDFKWFRCMYCGVGNTFDNVVICSNKTEEELYDKLLRIENLKVFL